MEKGMATHSSILTWRIPWTGGLQSTGLRLSTFLFKKRFIIGIGSVIREAEKSHDMPSASWRPGKLRCSSFSVQSPEETDGRSPIWAWRPVNEDHCWGRRQWVLSSDWESIRPSSTSCSLALGGPPDAHLHKGGRESGSDWSPTQMLVSFTNTITDTPGRDLQPSVWESLSPGKWAHKIDDHFWANMVFFNIKCFHEIKDKLRNWLHSDKWGFHLLHFHLVSAFPLYVTIYFYFWFIVPFKRSHVHLYTLSFRKAV